MKNDLKFLSILILTLALAFTGCDDSSGGGSKLTFDTADTPGDLVSIKAGSETVNMIYANNQESINFPFFLLMPFRDVLNPIPVLMTSTLTEKFFMGQTEVTNAVFAQVLQWAYDQSPSRFSDTVEDNNGIDSQVAKHEGQVLINFSDEPSMPSMIAFDTTTKKFSVETGHENCPVVCMSLYGAIMFCNWLTEMRDGNTENLVYTGMDEGDIWDIFSTLVDSAKTGYRLPSNYEWYFAATYIGTAEPTEGDLKSEYIARDVNSGPADLTEGYYWTPPSYASGAVKRSSFEIETRAVAWFSGDTGMEEEDKIMPVMQKDANQLGIYDMSGNVWEKCFDDFDGAVLRGGCFLDNPEDFPLSFYLQGDNNGFFLEGFRFVRTVP